MKYLKMIKVRSWCRKRTSTLIFSLIMNRKTKCIQIDLVKEEILSITPLL